MLQSKREGNAFDLLGLKHHFLILEIVTECLPDIWGRRYMTESKGEACWWVRWGGEEISILGKKMCQALEFGERDTGPAGREMGKHLSLGSRGRHCSLSLPLSHFFPPQLYPFEVCMPSSLSHNANLTTALPGVWISPSNVYTWLGWQFSTTGIKIYWRRFHFRHSAQAGKGNEDAWLSSESGAQARNSPLCRGVWLDVSDCARCGHPEESAGDVVTVIHIALLAPMCGNQWERKLEAPLLLCHLQHFLPSSLWLGRWQQHGFSLAPWWFRH